MREIVSNKTWKQPYNGVNIKWVSG